MQEDKFALEVYSYGGEGGKRIAIFFKRNFGDLLSRHQNLEKIAKYNKINLFVLDALQTNILDKRTYGMTEREFESYYTKNKIEYKKLYEFLKKFIIENRIDLCLFCANLIPFKADFLNDIRQITKIASCVQDDDVKKVADRISKPYLKHYDYSFCSSVYYKGDKILMKDKYKEWGARKTEFIPLGLSYGAFDEDYEVRYDNRDIDLVYVGGLYYKKLFRIFRLKKYFGDRMKIYGRGRTSDKKRKNALFKILLWYYNVQEITPLTDEEFIQIYHRTKIGFNLHQEYGPTNARMYELPGNGVMQLCDCEKGLKKIFELNKEVVAYKTFDELVDKIEYYLNHDDERIKIAKAGYEKVQNYRMEKIFKTLLDTVFCK